MPEGSSITPNPSVTDILREDRTQERSAGHSHETGGLKGSIEHRSASTEKCHLPPSHERQSPLPVLCRNRLHREVKRF